MGEFLACVRANARAVLVIHFYSVQSISDLEQTWLPSVVFRVSGRRLGFSAEIETIDREIRTESILQLQCFLLGQISGHESVPKKNLTHSNNTSPLLVSAKVEYTTSYQGGIRASYLLSKELWLKTKVSTLFFRPFSLLKDKGKARMSIQLPVDIVPNYKLLYVVRDASAAVLKGRTLLLRSLTQA